MPPSDKNKPADGSVGGEDQTQGDSKHQKLNSPGIESSSTISSPPGQSMIKNIPLITANLPTLECSINDQMKTFDPGEDGGIERLTRNSCENSTVQEKNSNSCCNSVVKNSSKNYKAGSKINKLADMLAKRSQNVVEVTQNSTSDLITDIKCAPKVEETVFLNNGTSVAKVGKSLDNSIVSFEKTANSLGVVRKSRRKSVPNPSCNLSQLQLQSTSSKSCSDFSKLFRLEENCETELNALEGSGVKVQTDESTKKKVVRKNLKNVELPLILPERKRRSSMRNEAVVSNKIIEKVLCNSSEIFEGNKKSECPKEVAANSIQSPNRSAASTKKSKVKQRKSKRLVETSTQTTDIEFISVIKPEISEDKSESETNEKGSIFECLYCTQNFSLKSECKAHEKVHSQKSNKQVIKCQYCFKKLSSLDELKSHCAQKHPYKYAYCLKCDERFVTKEQLFAHNKEIHINKSTDISQSACEEAKKLVVSLEKSKIDTEEKQNDKKTAKQNVAKTDLKVDVSCDMSKKSSVSPRNVQKTSPKENKTEEQLLEQEMLFYSNLSGNIQENLTNHLDGKIDNTGHPVRTDQINEPTETKSSSLLSVVAPSTGVPDVQILRAPSPYQTRSKTPNPLPPTAKKFKKLPNWQQKFWEKYNFPTNYRYEHRFWDKNYLNTEKSAFYLKDLSCLDIKTQLTMRENIKKLDDIKVIEENQKPFDKLKFPDYLSLVPRVINENSQDLKESSKASAELLKTKKQNIKEEIKKSFKPPVSEMTGIKNRKTLNTDNSSNKKQVDKSVSEGRKMITRRQSSIDLLKECQEDKDKKRKGSLDMSTSQRMTLRRQASLDSIQKSDKSKAEKNEQLNLNEVDLESMVPLDSTEISGEWVRPRSYLCGTCCTKFTNLWELEDHKWVTHPNVWCTHYEFEDEKLDKLFQHTEEEEKEYNLSEPSVPTKLKLTDLYKRYLLPHGSLKTAKLVPSTNFPEKCTKCKKSCINSSELHKHMLDCGGDTTWFLTMHSSPMTIKKKWRPFGSKRRRNQLGRRDFKRNIPCTPTMRSCHFQPRIRTKPGDVESIQKMLANLPEKRARRAINFDEIKTRSQATIHSNRLLRKRFKSTFATNLLKLQKLKQQKRQVKEGRKEGSSKSGTDTSSENTPTGSPKRKNKNKDNLQTLKEENEKKSSRESNESLEVKVVKKKTLSKKKESGGSQKEKSKTVKQETNKNKPTTRNNGFTETSLEGKGNEQVLTIKEEVFVEPVSIPPNSLNCNNENKGRKDISKKLEKSKKKVTSSLSFEIKKEPTESLDSENVPNSNKKVTPDSPTKKLKRKTEIINQNKVIKKQKGKVKNVKDHPILRLKQSKETKDLIKRIKKKVNKSKKILELKQTKILVTENRRSPRIKSQLSAEEKQDNAKVFVEKEETVSRLIKKEIINSDIEVASVVLKSPMAKAGKVSPKVKENAEELPGRRLLRNSFSAEEKPEAVNSFKLLPSSNNSKKIPTLRRSSRSFSDAEIVPLFDEAAESPRKHARNEKTAGEKSSSAVFNGQISPPKKNKSNTETNKVEEVVEVKKSNSNDLAEMPVLAKVVPIRSKNVGKSEKEIPVLLPVEKEQNGEKEEESSSESCVSFQVVKKRKKTFKEVTPLKIIKKVESTTENFKIGSKKTSEFKKQSSKGLSENGKVRKKKHYADSLKEKADKKTKMEAKKYFLGICPNEIDKGRGEIPEESGSDNEPLISLVVSQLEKKVENTDFESEPSVLTKEKQTIQSQSLKKVIVIKNKKKQKKLISEKIPKLENEKEQTLSLEISSNSSVDLNPQANSIPENITDENSSKSDDEKPKITSVNVKSVEAMKKGPKKKKSKRKIKNTPFATITLKEPTLKIVDEIPCAPVENKWVIKPLEQNLQPKTEKLADADVSLIESHKENGVPERRSRRISKETKTTNEFVIDDPLILVDELWSDLDSDSEGSRKRSKKGKKKFLKKKSVEEKRKSDVDLEELLRNFGENKENGGKKIEEISTLSLNVIKLPKKSARCSRSWTDIRKVVENRKICKPYRRLSLQLFQFNKTVENFGNRGQRLLDAKKLVQKKQDEVKHNHLPDLPFLAAEIKENPVQIIQCGTQKSKTPKRVKKIEQKCDIHFKISLPLESISNAVFNNNHLTELIVDEPSKTLSVEVSNLELEKDISSQETELPNKEIHEDSSTVASDGIEVAEFKNRGKRSEVVDKIFYCELCKTYYYLYSHLRSHKMSNRHKQKESELQAPQQLPDIESKETEEVSSEKLENDKKYSSGENFSAEIRPDKNTPKVDNVEDEKTNDDILEMPTLEGPFIENPLVRPVTPVQVTPQPSLAKDFNLNPESLKNLQKAIGCTDEEMLILTLLGDNTIELENDILDLDSCKANRSNINEDKSIKVESSTKENDSTNGAFKLDLKKRMTSALTSLVNKAVFNLIQKYKKAAKSSVNPEALTLLKKLSKLSRRRNILQLNELLKNQTGGGSSIGSLLERKEPAIIYKYQCTICGSRFEKASTREFHMSRSHKVKSKKALENTPIEEDWNDSWSTYDVSDDHMSNTSTSQFWCSDCGINFTSPQEVLEHQKIEHQPTVKEPETTKEASPLQSSKIGSSDEIIEGRKTRKQPKKFSSEELDQRRIMANNELRKLDRKINKSKSNKNKWGMDALRFTVEKENSLVEMREEKDVAQEQPENPSIEIKNIDIVPKLNLSRTGNIPEFKVIQKNSIKSRFQKIIDNKLKRKSTQEVQQETETEDVETEVMLVPVVVKKKSKKQKLTKSSSKKGDVEKPMDIYDFNESESEGEPMVFSHKRPLPRLIKLKLIKKGKEGPSRNKADSTTKDLSPDDYDSEDSLPLSVVKKESKPGDEEDDKNEKISEDGIEKSEGILEQVEYLIEQLENETGSSSVKNDEKEEKERDVNATECSNVSKEVTKEDSVDFAFEGINSVKVSVANTFLDLGGSPIKESTQDKNIEERSEASVEEAKVDLEESILAEPESSQSTFDEEDSMPLVMISKRGSESKAIRDEEKKNDESTTDISTTASEDAQIFVPEKEKSVVADDIKMVNEESSHVFSSSENEGRKLEKPFETVNGNVIYCRNDSVSDFGSDLSNDSVRTNFENIDSRESFIKEVTEKEDVVIVCSKGGGGSDESKERLNYTQKKKKENLESSQRKKKRFPLLTATIEENNFRKSESPKLNKEVIVRRIWSRRKLTGDSTDNEEDHESLIESIQNDESQTEVDKEVIVKKIWNRKKVDHDEETSEKGEDLKINQTEVSDEVVIKCGPRAKASPKKRRSRSSTIETSKETIMRKIWSGKYTFQTKAALKTYDSDMLPNCKENKDVKPKKRGRPSGTAACRKTKNDSIVDKGDEDDLDSLLEEIEREQLEKAIRLEFLQLRRSEKGNVEILKEGSNSTVGLFTETGIELKKDLGERKRRKVKKKLKHPRQSLLKRKSYLKKPIRKIRPKEERLFNETSIPANAELTSEPMDSFPDKNGEKFIGESKIKFRKHKKHRHKHHHHKHKHKKSKHHKSILSKHKSKHKFESDKGIVTTDSFSILERICSDIPNQIEIQNQTKDNKKMSAGENENLGTDVDFPKSPFSFESKTKDNEDSSLSVKERFETGSGNIYDFVDDFSVD